MINLYFNAEKQILKRTDRENLASNSREIHQCNFTLSDEWAGMQVTATFMYMGRKWSVLLSNGACIVPAEVLRGQEGFLVGLYGTNGQQVITTTLIRVPVSKGACMGGLAPQITPSMFDQIMAKIEELEEDELTIEDVNNAIEEYFEEHPDLGLNPAEVFNAITRSGLINLTPNYADYTDGLEKTDTAAGVNYYVIAPGHIGPYDSMDYGCIMANITGQAAAESVFTLVNTSEYLPAGKYKLRNTWSLSAHDVEIVYSYINGADNEVILATVDSEHEVVDFEITPEIITAGYRQRLYIRVKEGAEYGAQIYPLLTYGYVTNFDNIPNSYVRNNNELTQNVINLEDSTTNLQGRMLNVESGKQDKIQFVVMPAASADLLGKIYQYTGATNANYTEGHWYKCVENSGVYSWESTGEDGNIPNITATATVDNTTGTPAVNVTKAGTDAAPEFTFAFSGLKGASGANGKSAYQIAVDNGFSGTEQEWLESLTSPVTKIVTKSLMALEPDTNMIEGAFDFSGTWDNASAWSDAENDFNGYPVKQKSSSWSPLSKAVNIEAGKIYTFSAWVKAENASDIRVYPKKTTGNTATLTILDSSSSLRQYSNTIPNNTWFKVMVTFICNTSGTASPFVVNTNTGNTYVTHYKLEEGIPTGKIFRIEKDGSGDFTSFVDGINTACQYKNSIVYVGEGVFDLLDELGEAYVNAASETKKGLVLKNQVHVICSSRTVLSMKYTGSLANVKSYLSAINTGSFGCILENARIETDNVRYAIHDDLGGNVYPYRNKFINCSLKHTNGQYKMCIGGGIGKSADVEIRGCYFEGDSDAQSLVYYHGNNKTGETAAKGRLVVNNNYFANNGTFSMTNYGDSEEVTTAYLCGNSLGAAPYVSNGSYAPHVNTEIIAWNNDIRTA